jgi:hypothetical protein
MSSAIPSESNPAKRPQRVRQITVILALAFGLVVTGAHAQEEDPSLPTGPIIGDLPEGLPEANEGAFEGGVTGTSTDPSEQNSISEEAQSDGGIFNVPSNGPPSPLFGAEPFSQQMLRFEGFGTEKLKLRYEEGSQELGVAPDPCRCSVHTRRRGARRVPRSVHLADPHPVRERHRFESMVGPHRILARPPTR